MSSCPSFVWQNPYFLIFMVTPPVLLVVWRFRQQRWLLLSFFLCFVAAGWPISFAAVDRYYQLLTDYVAATNSCHDVLTDDGAKYAFAHLFGWLYAIVYFGAWTIMFWIGSSLVRLGRHGPRAAVR